MEQPNAAAKPQPKPTPGKAIVLERVLDMGRRDFGHDPAFTDLTADLCARDSVGRQRYGTPLMTHNGRDALVDAYQELLDAVQYTGQAVLEAESKPMQVPDHASTRLRALEYMHRRVTQLALDMRRTLDQHGHGA